MCFVFFECDFTFACNSVLGNMQVYLYGVVECIGCTATLVL